MTAQDAIARSPEVEADPYAKGLVLGVAKNRGAIDELLEHHLADWSLGRLGVLERSILRVAAYELLGEIEVPSAVAINEAVALAKRFCSAEAGALVNGVLGSLVTSEDPGGDGASRPVQEAREQEV